MEGLINSELPAVLQEASMLPSHSAYLSRNPSLCWCPGGKGAHLLCGFFFQRLLLTPNSWRDNFLCLCWCEKQWTKLQCCRISFYGRCNKVQAPATCFHGGNILIRLAFQDRIRHKYTKCSLGSRKLVNFVEAKLKKFSMHLRKHMRYSSSSSSSSYIFHGVGPLVDPFRSHVSRSLFKGLPWFLPPVGQ